MAEETKETKPSYIAGTGLGQCKDCFGPLCTSSRVENGQHIPVVKCDVCGNEVLDHPVLSEKPTGAAVIRTTRDPQPIDYPASWGDRIAKLEKTIKAQETRIDALEQALARRKAG